MDTAGGNVKRITDNPAHDSDPAWSPDGSKIAFASDRDGNYDIYVIGSDGKFLTRLINNLPFEEIHDRYPAWSPDGKKIAFTRYFKGGGSCILVTNFNGNGVGPLGGACGSAEKECVKWDYIIPWICTDLKTVYHYHWNDVEPAWSPDGSKIAFARGEKAGGSDFYAFDVWVQSVKEGSKPEQLTKNPGIDDHPAWSPDGSKILFVSYQYGDPEIYTMNPNGTGQTAFFDTPNPAMDWEPAWSQDGTRMAFASNRDGKFQIYVANADGTGLTRMKSNGSDTQPDWGPKSWITH